MRYPTLLFDLDHTLLDSDASEAAAFADTVRGVGLEPTDELFHRYRSVNKALWSAVERGETTPNELRLTRFERFIDLTGIDAEATDMADAFTTGLGANGELLPGARAVLDDLAGRATLGLVTNGLSEVQRARIERLDLERYFEVVIISAEVGTSKPGTAIFDLTFEQLGRPSRNGSLMIGDSLTSDIQGGTNYGIDTCWYNPAGSSANGTTPTHEIADLDRLRTLVLG